MTYTIKEVAEKIGLSAYTLRFYDKQGLLPFVSRNQSGYRAFTDGDLHLLHTIICLKNTGMAISDIRQYIDYVMAGPDSIPQRRALLTAHRNAILAEQAKIMKNLQEVDYKLNLYNDPQASELVNQELAQAKSEKQASGLADPFPVTE
ncbi:MerR family transcriptional regulator [Lactiplantibacillus pentosus]|uniref:MerR family transcriptional regulator n=1 Tax=Lactiplantibacillus pentosus TaxID=1589 RepID=UPI001CFFE8D2|nr:MerR family transcriptional regulator [Lactiplantibacillus pentosus]MCB5220958.1 MerR family transcriptional regulator [Lactiplantibacillus pentosus]MCT3289318.1 MerR family transcriptional regulator [Lactiplantibacillus pentosus]